MMNKLTPLEQTFLDLAAIDEVYPHEQEVIAYVEHRLREAGWKYTKDKSGNIVARHGETKPQLALVGHLDIAAPLAGREIIISPDRIATDGSGILGADDKAAVAIMLELARTISEDTPAPELIFTIGEEAGCVGAVAIDPAAISAKQALVLDWLGSIANIVTKSPAYMKLDVTFTGRTAHPAHWQDGRNAGAALIAAAAKIRQGEYHDGVTCNIGIMKFGEARNQVPGTATLQGELRSYDTGAAQAAAAEVKQVFEATATKLDVSADVRVAADSPAYELDEAGAAYLNVVASLKAGGLVPNLQSTYGCFDGNILAKKGLEVVMLGAGYYNPHSPSEYLDRAEFAQALAVILQICRKY